MKSVRDTNTKKHFTKANFSGSLLFYYIIFIRNIKEKTMQEINYSLNMEYGFSTEEMIKVFDLVNLVMDAQEKKIDGQKLIKAYRNYQKILPAKADQRSFERDFEKQTGYSIYQTIKQYL